MNRLIAWICLIVVLTGPLLSLVEKADDLARSASGRIDPRLMQPIDGGVGDDPIEALSGSSVLPSGMDQMALPVRIDNWMVLAGDLRQEKSGTLQRCQAVISWFFSTPSRRLAWFQTFLI